MYEEKVEILDDKAIIDTKYFTDTLNAKPLAQLLKEIGQRQIMLNKDDLFVRLSFIYSDGLNGGYCYSIIQHNNDTSYESTYSRFFEVENEKTFSHQEAYVSKNHFLIPLSDSLTNSINYLIDNLQAVDSFSNIRSGQLTYFEAFNNGRYTQFMLDIDKLYETETGSVFAYIIKISNTILLQNTLQEKHAKKLIKDLTGE